ncbi:hypothetical protein WMY93_007670 [Mugilogobius chulae]|uniref:WW domain-containing protein n=1 Tax=Mugilogobius chulae TaxID=88201 RepID=A0AAW0PHC0_9GOBI
MAVAAGKKKLLNRSARDHEHSECLFVRRASVHVVRSLLQLFFMKTLFRIGTFPAVTAVAASTTDGKRECVFLPQSIASGLVQNPSHTKPLTFADCIGDELPVGWEEAYDPVVGPYFVDHNTKSTQLEDPRAQWQREQEAMLREYLSVARDALSAQREIYEVKEQRLRLAQQEYRQLNEQWRDKSSSHTSLNSRSSTSSKYDPDILKAEIATAKSRVNKLKRDLACMKQELQFKEQGVETLKEVVRSCFEFDQ